MKRREIVEFVQALATEVPAVTAAAGVPPDTCVLQAKIAVEVAREAGLLAQPFPVRLTATPPEGSEFRGKPYARRLGFGNDDTIQRLGLENLKVVRESYADMDDRWDGHLGALVARRYFVDPSIGQLAMKMPAVPVEPVVVEVDRDFVRARKPAAAVFPNGSTIVYEATPDNKAFLDQDYRAEPAIAREILRRIRRRLA
jgi:hypothetical protein